MQYRYTHQGLPLPSTSVQRRQKSSRHASSWWLESLDSTDKWMTAAVCANIPRTLLTVPENTPGATNLTGGDRSSLCSYSHMLMRKWWNFQRNNTIQITHLEKKNSRLIHKHNTRAKCGMWLLIPRDGTRIRGQAVIRQKSLARWVPMNLATTTARAKPSTAAAFADITWAFKTLYPTLLQRGLHNPFAGKFEITSNKHRHFISILL